MTEPALSAPPPAAAAPVGWAAALAAVLRGTRAANPEPLPAGHIAVAQDCEGGAKRYRTVPLTGLAQARDALPPPERCLYGVQARASPCHLFWDLERKGVTAAESIRAAAAVWAACEASAVVQAGDRLHGLLLLRSVQPEKQSLHLHVVLAQPWAHVGHVALAARDAYAHLPDWARGWVDTGVWNVNRCFRIAGCHKRGKPPSTALQPVALDEFCTEEHAGDAQVAALAATLAARAPPSDAVMAAWSAAADVAGGPVLEVPEGAARGSVGSAARRTRT